jgi:L-Ala-D/L-Glu epimerase
MSEHEASMNRRDFLAACGVAAGGLGMTSASASAAGQEIAQPASPSRTHLRFEIVRLELKHAWTIARGTAAFKDNVLAYFERDGLTGVGEAGHLTAAGQTAAQTVAGLEKLRPLYEGVDPFVFHELPAAAARVAGVTAPARAALELALMDWVGQKLNLPLYRLFGLNPRRVVPTSFSIGLDTPDAVKAKVREAGDFSVLKVKLGGPADQEIIRVVRSVTDKPIRVDANEGWPDKETAIKNIEWLERQGIELVEQPLPRRFIEETRWLKERTRLPLVADEAVSTARDIPALAGAYTGINIKLMKAGGWLEALRMFEVAQAHGLDAMLGCMIETSVAITAAVHLQSLARWVDLDGNLLLRADPYAGAIFQSNHWEPPEAPGLGVRPRKT